MRKFKIEYRILQEYLYSLRYYPILKFTNKF